MISSMIKRIVIRLSAMVMTCLMLSGISSNADNMIETALRRMIARMNVLFKNSLRIMCSGVLI